jgi:hypothetical protein
MNQNTKLAVGLGLAALVIATGIIVAQASRIEAMENENRRLKVKLSIFQFLKQLTVVGFRLFVQYIFRHSGHIDLVSHETVIEPVAGKFSFYDDARLAS